MFSGLWQNRIVLVSLLFTGGRSTFYSTWSFVPTQRRISISSSPPARQQKIAFFSHTGMPSLEVEEKFSLTDRDLSQLRIILGENGFVLAGEATIVDWYLDVTENNTFELLRQDCWLRCRESNGQRTWQLKRGQAANKNKSAEGSSRAAVYEEIEGAEAVKIACSLLEMNNEGGNRISSVEPIENLQEGLEDEAPSILFADKCLDAFAKIVTHRSSWTVPASDAKGRSEMNLFRDLCVDLDVTDFDHAVGEVEALVQGASEVESARMHIKKLIDKNWRIVVRKESGRQAGVLSAQKST